MSNGSNFCVEPVPPLKRAAFHGFRDAAIPYLGG
jgi:hypothetical protein